MKRKYFYMLILGAALCCLSTLRVDALARQDENYAEALNAFNATRSPNDAQLPALKKTLANPRLNTYARSALEAFPGDEGRKALREGLTLDSPECVAGCVVSLGNLKDVESSAQIAALARDGKSAKIVRVAALRALGKLENPEVKDVMIEALSDEDREIRLAASDGLFALGRATKDAALFQVVRLANVDAPTTRIATQNEVVYGRDLGLFAGLLRSQDRSDVRAACAVLSTLKDPEFANAVIDQIERIAPEYRELLARTSGDARDPSVVVKTLELWEKAKRDSSLIAPNAVLEALATQKDARAFPAFFDALSAQDVSTRDAAINGIAQYDALSDEQTARLASALADASDDDAKRRAFAVLEVVKKRGLVALVDQTKACAQNRADVELASSALETYAELAAPSAENVETFIDEFQSASCVDPGAFERALRTFCRRATDKRQTIDVLEKRFAASPEVLARLVGVMGGKIAADYLGDLALKHATNSTADQTVAVVDEVTKALGEWSTNDASDALARLCVLLPEGRLGKFKTRAIRGYLRLLRQMGDAPLAKRQKLSFAKRITENRPQEREILDKIDPNFGNRFPERPLFNGKDFSGWQEYASGVFGVEDGAIVGGSFEQGLDKNQFLTTEATFGDFYLRLECKIVVGEKNPNNDGNAGVQFRSERIPDNWEMIGYQADMTSDGGYWGCLYDESRRNRMLQTPSFDVTKGLWIPNDWNTYEILCQGKNVKIFLNGVKTVDYDEEDESIVQSGKIGLQIHAGGAARSYYRNVFICDVATDDSN